MRQIQRRVYPLPAIMPRDFRRFSEILRRDDEFPSHLVDWSEIFRKRADALAADGVEAVAVLVRPPGFERYLEDRDIAAPDTTHLTAYAAHVMAGKPAS